MQKEPTDWEEMQKHRDGQKIADFTEREKEEREQEQKIKVV